MKRVIALLLCVVLMLPMLAACNDDAPEEAHVHTFAETWTSDAVGHWYAVTCGCADAKINKLNHTDANNDGACDVCTYTNHIHTYSEEWTVDCTNHWHAADCGHIVAGTDVAAHTDADNDGKCDVCTWVIEDIHEHYYATEWSNDDEYHWHAALCEHSVEVADKAAHELNAAGYCTVCDAKIQEIDATDIAAVLAAAVAQNNKVTGGKVYYLNNIYDAVLYGDEYYWESSASVNNEVYYTLGNGYAYVNYLSITDYGTYPEQQWYELLDAENESVFGVTSTDGGITFTTTMGSMQMLNGYNYVPSTLLASFDDTSTLAATLLAIYELSQSEGAKDVEVEYDAEDGVYEICYTYVATQETEEMDWMTGETSTVLQVSVFEVEAAFTVDELGVVNVAEIYVDSYQDVDWDDDFDYNAETGEITWADTAAPNSYCYAVTQTSGERTYVTAYPMASLVPSSFDLTYNGEVVGDTLTVDAGVFTSLYVVNIAPVGMTTDYMADFVEVEITNNDSESDYTPYGYYSAWSEAVSFQINQVGSYTMTVKYLGEVINTITITANPAKVESIGLHQFNWVSGWGSTWYEAASWATTSATVTAGETLDFAVIVNPEMANQNYTYSIDSENATVSKVTLTDVMANYTNYETYEALQFTSDVAGTYTITVVSAEDETITATVTITVEAPAGGDDGEDGDETAGGIQGTYDATDDFGNTITVVIDATTVTFHLLNGSTAVYDYVVEAGNVTLSQNGIVITMPMQAYIGLDANGVANMAINNLTQYTLTKRGGSEGDDNDGADISGTYVGTDDYGNSFLTVTIDSAAQTVVFNYNHPVFGPSSVSATYEISNGVMTLYDADGSVLNPMAGMITLTDGVPTAAAYNGNNYTLAKEGSSGNEGGNGGNTETSGSGTEGDPYVWAELPESVTFNSDTINKIYYLFTAEQTGTLTITWPTADSWVDIFEMQDGNTTANNNSAYETQTFTFEVTAGSTYRLSLGTWMGAGEVTLTISIVTA